MYHRLMNVSQIVHCSHEIHSVNTKFQKIVYHPSQFTVHRKWDPPQKIYKVPYSGIRSYNPAPARLAGPPVLLAAAALLQCHTTALLGGGDPCDEGGGDWREAAAPQGRRQRPEGGGASREAAVTQVQSRQRP